MKSMLCETKSPWTPTGSTLFDIPALAKINALQNEMASRPNSLKNQLKTRNPNQINRVRNEIQPTTPSGSLLVGRKGRL